MVAIDGQKLCVFKLSYFRLYRSTPNMEECLANLQGCKWFSKVDVKKAYNEIHLEENCRHCRTKITSRGNFIFKRLPVGIKI